MNEVSELSIALTRLMPNSLRLTSSRLVAISARLDIDIFIFLFGIVILSILIIVLDFASELQLLKQLVQESKF